MKGLVAALVALGWGGAALAGPVDCKGDGFRKALKLKPDYGFDCVEVKTVPSPVDGGGWTIRAVRNASTEAGYVQPFAELALETFGKAFQVWEPYTADLGFNFRNVTVVFVDPLGSEIDFDFQIHGFGKGVGAAHADGFSFPEDCVVAVNIPEIKAIEPEQMAQIFAHEAFHCVQSWSYGKANNPGDGKQVWWQEGTAEFFASMVQMDAGRYLGNAGAFLGSIREKPLTQQAYNSAIFFAYVWQQGSGVMGSLLKGLATQPGEMAQMQATEAALGPELLAGFAKALVDGTIALPSGMEFPALEDGKPFVFSGDGQFESGKVPFTVDARQVGFMGGSYAVADAARYAVRPTAGGAWAEMPTTVTPKVCSQPEEFMAVRFVGTLPKDSFGFPVTATKYKDCAVCQSLMEADQCVVGTWRLRQESMLSYLQKAATGRDEVRYTSVGGSVSFVAGKDGTAQWVSEGLQVEAVVAPKEILPEIDVRVQADGVVLGHWSTAKSQMNFCAESQEMDYVSKVKIPGMDEDVVTTEMPLEPVFLTYECGPSTLTMVYTGPTPVDGPAPTWVLDRVK